MKIETGLFDKNGTPIKIGDKTRLVLGDEKVILFDVTFKTVERTLSYDRAESITGIVFTADGNDYFPIVDENGISDVSKMEVVHTCPYGEKEPKSDNKRMTNADHIRVMTDEELAEFLLAIETGTYIFTHSTYPIKNTLEWLQSEVKESKV